MSSQPLPIKCQHPNCKRQGATIKTLPNGDKVLTVKNTRHDGQIHAQEYTAKELNELFAGLETNFQRASFSGA